MKKQKRKTPKILPKSDAKETAKMLADVIRNLAPVYAKHGKKIAGIVLPKP